MTGTHLALAVVFAAAVLVPLLWRLNARAGRAVGVFVPAALTAYFVAIAPAVLRGEPERGVVPWVPALGVDLAVNVDGLGLLFALLVCGIGALVLLFSDAYLHGDPRQGRFTGIMLAFLASMLGLVVADDLLLVYVFWGLTGLTSFLLIGFDHERRSARDGANQAFLLTAAGELAMLAGFVLLAGIAGTGRLSEMAGAAEAASLRTHALYVPTLVLILAGALTKSAQVPFHFWLPNAMEAPTPVSAYLHSATMVKAGVYLIARLAPILAATGAWVGILTVVGAATLVLGAWMSLGQTDLKRILAYSTVAALGLMVLLLGLDTPEASVAAIAVLLAHAAYKGALFLVAGSIDHGAGTRDVTRLGGLRGAMPLTATAGLIAAASMIGLPGLLGFIGKELAYKATLDVVGAAVVVTAVVVAAGIAFVAVAGITGVLPFFGRTDAGTGTGADAHETPARMWVAPTVLAAMGLVAGIAPSLFAGPLIAAAASDVVGGPIDAKILPWYPPDLALALSVVTVLAGLGLLVARRQARSTVTRLDVGERLGPERAWEGLVTGTVRFAGVVSATSQTGRLRQYMLIVFVTTTVLAWGVVALLGGLPALEPSTDVRFWEVGAAGAILVGAFVALRADSRLSAVAALGVVGYGIALVYLLFGAPDLAMIQVLIETLIIILFVLVFHHLPRFVTVSSSASRMRDAVVALAAGTLMGTLVLATSVRPHEAISSFFLEASYLEARGRNVVNVILIDFRGLDTLGEVTVLAVAGIGVFALLKLRPDRRADRVQAGAGAAAEERS
ncbi:MAG: hydrogen gas-evolving membrane-bound hydrogenase subunit E [Chloroflexota bacterium]